MKARKTDQGGVVIFCPACKEGHRIWIDTPKTPKNVPIWAFNNDLEKPTINPSISVKGMKKSFDKKGEWDGWEKDEKGNPIPHHCHSFVVDGMIQFLGDCTHELANRTVPLPDF